MNGAMDFVMLVCAVAAALAAGVLLGYVACKGLFGLCSMHVRAIAAQRSATKSEASAANA